MLPGEFAVRVAVALQAQLIGAASDRRIAGGLVGVGHHRLLIGDEFGAHDGGAGGVCHLPLLDGGAMVLSGGDLDHPMHGDQGGHLNHRELRQSLRLTFGLCRAVFGRCTGRQHPGEAGQQRSGEHGVRWHRE